MEALIVRPEFNRLRRGLDKSNVKYMDSFNHIIS